MFKTTLLAAAMTATLAAPLAAPSSAKEEGSIVPTFDSVNNVFVDFVLNGCLSSMNGRSPGLPWPGRVPQSPLRREVQRRGVRQHPNRVPT